MPLGDIGEERLAQYLPLSIARARLAERYTFEELDYRSGGPARYVRETGLIVFGSRVRYAVLLKLQDPRDARRFTNSHRRILDDARARVQTAQDTEDDITRTLDNMGNFLQFVGLIALLVVLVLAAAGYGIYALLHRPQPAPFQSMSISKLTDMGKAFMAAISPDGKYVVHVVEDAGQQGLWIHHIVTNSVTQIVPPADTQYSGLTFSPDGNYIYFTRIEKEHPGLGLLYQIPVLGGAPKLIVTDVDTRISFSPDGRRFAFCRDSNLGTSAVMIANTDGSDVHKLVEDAAPASFGGHPAWSPDGEVIAVMEYFGPQAREPGAFLVVETVTGRKTEIASSPG